MVFCPDGPANSTSTSSGYARELVVKSFKPTVTLEIVPGTPVIAIVDGYGVAGVSPLRPLEIAIEVLFRNVVVVGVGVGCEPSVGRPRTMNSIGRAKVFC